MKYWIAFISSFASGILFHTANIIVATIIDMVVFAVKLVIWPFVGIYLWCVNIINLWDELRLYQKTIIKIDQNSSSRDGEPNNETRKT